MRLGLWNRLAIVAGGITLLVAPTWFIRTEKAEIAETHMGGYRACMSAGQMSFDDCWSNWMEDYWSPGWAEWWQTVGATAFLLVLAYLLVWSAVWVAKWVWRGRVEKPASE